MEEINVSDFRQKCLALIEDLPAEGLLITKHGRPVATITPVSLSNAGLIASIPGLTCDANDDLFATGIEWHAQS